MAWVDHELQRASDGHHDHGLFVITTGSRRLRCRAVDHVNAAIMSRHEITFIMGSLHHRYQHPPQTYLPITCREADFIPRYSCTHCKPLMNESRERMGKSGVEREARSGRGTCSRSTTKETFRVFFPWFLEVLVRNQALVDGEEGDGPDDHYARAFQGSP